jgi:hypothetical protein
MVMSEKEFLQVQQKIKQYWENNNLPEYKARGVWIALYHSNSI